MMRLAFAAVLLTLSAPAIGRTTFALYDGPDAERVGQGGTRITKNGIDWWTTGSPAKRYRVIGIITDQRSNKPFRGQAIGSKSIAKQVLEASGDAIVIVGQDERATGMSGAGGFSGGNGWLAGKTITRTTSQLLVIKYL